MGSKPPFDRFVKCGLELVYHPKIGRPHPTSFYQVSMLTFCQILSLPSGLNQATMISLVVFYLIQT